MTHEQTFPVGTGGHDGTPGAARSFTAAQIAAGLGKTPRAVRKLLRDVRPAGVRIVAGNEAAIWTVEQLPGPLRESLAAEAAQQHCRTIEALLSMPKQRWQPAIPMDNISDANIQTATKLRDALKPWLIQQHDPNLSAAEMVGTAQSAPLPTRPARATPRPCRENRARPGRGP